MPYPDYKKRLKSRYWVLLVLPILLAACLILPFSSSPVRADGGFPLIGVLRAGQRPEGIAVDTRTHMVYIAYEFPSFVVGFDPVRGKVRWRVPTGDSATDVQADSINHRVYTISIARNGETGTFTILDGGSGKILFSANTASGDDGLAIDTQRQRAYIASSDAGLIDVFSLSTSPAGKISALSSTLKVGSHPQAVGINSRLGRLYVGDKTAHTVTVVDEDSSHTLATIPVAAGPVQPLSVDEATGRVYVVCSTGQELDIIDGQTNKVIARVPVSPYPEGVTSNTATGRIYVAEEGNKETTFNDVSSGTSITVIDGQSLELLGTMQVGHAPDGVASDPALRRIYVAVEDSNSVVEISDSLDLPLQAAPNYHQVAAIHQAIVVLQGAAVITVILMILTIIGAIQGARSRRWHAPETPQIPPDGASSHLKHHTPLA